MKTPKPLRLIVLYAWLPDHNNPHQPGPKYRPVLVLDINPQNQQLLVVYGTSQNTQQMGKGEFTVHLEGLSKPTKFCFAYQRWIPANDLYLCKNGKKHVVGSLPSDYYDRVIDALEEIDS
mgnify:CR=1 FL=1